MKVHGTRKEKALELLDCVRRGPAFLEDVVAGPKAPFSVDPVRDYGIWVDTWVIPRLHELIPELKAIRKARETAEKKGREATDNLSDRDLVLTAHKTGGLIEAIRALRRRRLYQAGDASLQGCKTEVEEILRGEKP